MAICAIYARKSTDQIGVADKQRSVAQPGWLVAVWMAITLAPIAFGQPKVDLRAAQKATLLEAIPGGAPQYFLPQGSPIDVEVFPRLVSRALLEVLNRIVRQNGLAWQYLDDVANSSRSIQLRAFEGENFRVGVSAR